MDETIRHDDARGFSDHDLTTWALGELDALDPATVAAIEATVASDAETGAAAAAVRALAATLASTFAPDRAAAPDLRLSAEQRAVIRSAAAAAPAHTPFATRWAAPFRAAWAAVRGWSLGWQLGTLASAAIVLVFVVLPTATWLFGWGRYTAAGIDAWRRKAASSEGHKSMVAEADPFFNRPTPPTLWDTLTLRRRASHGPIDAEEAAAEVEIAPGAPLAEGPDRRAEVAAAEPTGLYLAVQATPGAGVSAPGLPGSPPSAGGDDGNRAAEAPPPVAPSSAGRKVIKDATLSLEVASVPATLGRIETIAAQSGGYVVETRTDLGGAPGAAATIRIGVPVDQFELALQRVRDAGATVLREHTSGVDASQEYVDLQSQVANLEATQARIRQFLEQATTVEESLRVNAQLAEIEGQLGQIKGRMRFLADRAAYSTITAELYAPAPAETPTPTPTPTPVPGWSAADEARAASNTLAGILRILATLAIWLAVVVLPLAAPVALVWWGVRGRRSTRQA